MLFQEKDKWNEVSADKVTNDIDAYYSLKQQILKKPFPIALRVESGSSLSRYTSQFATQLIRSAKESYCPFSFSLVSRLDESITSFIEIFNEEFYINLAGVGSFRANFQPPMCIEDLKILISDIYVALAFILQNLSHIREANTLFDNYPNKSNFKYKEFIFFSYLSTKVQLNLIPDALKYIVTVDKQISAENDDLNFAQFGLSLIISQVPKGQKRVVVNTYHELIESTDDPLVKATYYYNIGNCLRGSNNDREAIKHYIKAAKLNPDYKLRPYWRKELAGQFLMIGKYLSSSKLYALLTPDDNTPENKVLYADSLMLAGKYKKALEILEEFEPKLTIRNSEWSLKSICLEYLIDKYELKAQIKQGEAGRDFIEQSSEDEILAFLESKNALCPDSQFLLEPNSLNAISLKRLATVS